MKALVSALALMGFVGVATIPAVAQAQTTAPAPVKKKVVKKKVTKKAKKAPAKPAM